MATALNIEYSNEQDKISQVNNNKSSLIWIRGKKWKVLLTLCPDDDDDDDWPSKYVVLWSKQNVHQEVSPKNMHVSPV